MSTVRGWQVLARPEPDAGVATVPHGWFTGADRLKPYVRVRLETDPTDLVTQNNQRVLPGAAPAAAPAGRRPETALLVVERLGAAGMQAFVQPATLGLGSGQGAWCSLTPMTADQYRTWRVAQAFCSPLGLTGLVVAILGLICSALVAIDQVTPYLPHVLTAVLAGLGPALQVIGAIVVFVQGAVQGR